MVGWVVRKWVRYGHERLYAETPGGTELGYLDLKTGRYHSDDISNLPLLEKAIADHLGEKPTSTDEPEQVEPEWRDISGVGAGSAAREQAEAARQAQGRVSGFFARLLDKKTDERAWRIGAQGEQAVAEQLVKLGPAWRIIHAVRVGERGSDIDHVLIGPPGVFTVNAKHHPNASIWVGGDTFMVNGHRVPYIRNSRHEAARAGRLLSEQAGFPVAAVGVIAVMGAHRGLTIREQPVDGAVVVVARKRISHYLRKLPIRLNAREIDVLYDVARRSTTWQ